MHRKVLAFIWNKLLTDIRIYKKLDHFNKLFNYSYCKSYKTEENECYFGRHLDDTDDRTAEARCYKDLRS